MKKIFFLVMLGCFGLGQLQAQKTANTNMVAFKTETRNNLVQKLAITQAVADRIVAVEMEFYAAVAAIPAVTKTKQKEVQLNRLHINRREKLMLLLNDSRKMEDAVAITDAARQKYSL